MENASKALLMAGGILIGVLILALMVTLFISSSSLFTSYEETKKSEATQQFNVNFTQYIGRELTIHEVVTICNFANVNNVKVTKIGNDYVLDKTQISQDIGDANEEYTVNYFEKKVKVEVIYTMKITSYNSNGHVSAIEFSNRRFKVTNYN